MSEPSILERPLYDETLAARVLGMPPSTLHWWLEGGVRNGRSYDPVLRTAPTGSKEVTWGELVEARYLRTYRTELGVKLADLREFIAVLRSDLGIQYPLAHAKPWVGPGRELLIKAQEESELAPELALCYSPASGLVLLTPPAESFLEQVDFDEGADDAVIRLYPAGKGSPVVIDPELRFGSPSVQGVSTETIAEMVRAGDPIERIASGYDLSLDDVVAALDFERTYAPLAA